MSSTQILNILVRTHGLCHVVFQCHIVLLSYSDIIYNNSSCSEATWRPVDHDPNKSFFRKDNIYIF
jgi:hypothetical protein